MGSVTKGWVSRVARDYGERGNHVYVKGGVGFSIVPARVHAVPEITVFTLTGSP